MNYELHEKTCAGKLLKDENGSLAQKNTRQIK